MNDDVEIDETFHNKLLPEMRMQPHEKVIHSELQLLLCNLTEFDNVKPLYNGSSFATKGKKFVAIVHE